MVHLLHRLYGVDAPVVLYPQNGDRIVTVASVTSLHPMYTSFTFYLYRAIHIRRTVLKSVCGISQFLSIHKRWLMLTDKIIRCILHRYAACFCLSAGTYKFSCYSLSIGDFNTAVDLCVRIFRQPVFFQLIR